VDSTILSRHRKSWCTLWFKLDLDLYLSLYSL